MRGKMSFRHCGICYKKVSEKVRRSQPPEYNVLDFRTEEEERCSLDDQLKVMFVLRKLLDVPEDICLKLIKNYGNPSSWFLCCDICCIFVDKAKCVFNQIAKLENFLGEIKSKLKSEIILSETTHKSSLLTIKRNEPGGTPTSIVRSFVSQGENCFEKRNEEHDADQLNDSNVHQKETPLRGGPSNKNINSFPHQKAKAGKIPETFQIENSSAGKSEMLNCSQMPTLIPEITTVISEVETCDIEFETTEGRVNVDEFEAEQGKQLGFNPTSVNSEKMMPEEKEILETNATGIKSNNLQGNNVPDVKIECGACGAEFSDESSFTVHTKAHEEISKSGNEYRKMKQKNIEKPLRRKFRRGTKKVGRKIMHVDIIQVVREEKGKEIEEYFCQICGRSFKSREVGVMHYRMHHGDRKGFKKHCSACNIDITFHNFSGHLKTKNHLQCVKKLEGDDSS